MTHKGVLDLKGFFLFVLWWKNSIKNGWVCGPGHNIVLRNESYWEPIRNDGRAANFNHLLFTIIPISLPNYLITINQIRLIPISSGNLADSGTGGTLSFARTSPSTFSLETPELAGLGIPQYRDALVGGLRMLKFYLLLVVLKKSMIPVDEIREKSSGRSVRRRSRLRNPTEESDPDWAGQRR